MASDPFGDYISCLCFVTYAHAQLTGADNVRPRHVPLGGTDQFLAKFLAHIGCVEQGRAICYLVQLGYDGISYPFIAMADTGNSSTTRGIDDRKAIIQLKKKAFASKKRGEPSVQISIKNG